MGFAALSIHTGSTFRSLWERWQPEGADGEGLASISIGLFVPSQSKIKNFCQLSQRESQVRYGAKLSGKLEFKPSTEKNALSKSSFPIIIKEKRRMKQC